MHWLMALIGAFVGALCGAADGAFLGLVLGAMIGWQGARIAQLRKRLQAVEEELVGGRTAPPQPARIAQPAAAARPTTAPVSTPASVAAATAPATNDAAPSAVPAATTTPPSAAPSAGPGTRATFESREPSAPPLASAGSAAATGAGASAAGATAAPATRRAPQEPDIAQRIGAALKRLLFEGNVPVKLGMLVLFFGVAAALKYAVDQGYVSFPIELRLSAIAAAALAGLVWGWRNREIRPAFGLSLQGGALGVLLLTVFASFGLYKLLPAGTAFALVLVLVAGAALLAVLQDAVWLAVLGFVGGYLAPVLISTGSGNHVALFSYYAVLNAAVFAIAWARSWRALNLIGFAFTFIVGTLWGAKYYRPENFATVEPFLILFFLFYVAIPVLYALRSPEQRRGFVDGTLVFGTPLIVFPLQAALLGEDRMALAYSALAMAALYASLGVWLLRSRGLVLLGQSFAALAVGFATLAVPLALSARWTSASWALEGAALVWLGLRQNRLLPKLSGWALQWLAAIAYLYGVAEHGWSKEAGELFVLNGHALSVTLMALALYYLSWLHERHGARRPLVWLGFVGGTFWWAVAGTREIVEHLSAWDASLAFVAFAALTCALAALLRGVIPWARLGWLVLGVALAGPLLVLATLWDIQGAVTREANLHWAIWFAALAFGLIRLREPHQRGLSLAHVAMLATAAWLYGAALHTQAQRGLLDDGWVFVAGLLPLLALLFLTWRAPALGAWPLADAWPRYRARWFVPAGVVMAIAWISALGEPGNSAPLPYLPLLNPVELFQLVLLLVALGLARHGGAAADPWRPALALAAFAFLSCAGLRAVHHFHGAPWSIEIFDDRIAQTTLTVIWSVLGVGAWIYGSRRRLWSVWLVGAVLMGVVLAKLVFVDRQYMGNVAGIVSFMAVGGLLVLVGRIAPTPPRQRAQDESEEASA